MATVFVHDTFTDTEGKLLTAHTGEIGATWVGETPGFPSTLYISGNRARGSQTSNSGAIASGASDGSEYDVEADAYLAGSGGGVIRLLARANTGDKACYHFFQSATSGSTIIQRASTSGALTSLASVTLSPPGVGAHRIIKAKVRDLSKKMYIDGVEVLSVTDNSVSGNHVGIRMQSAWEYQVDSLTATNFVPLPPSFWSHSQIIE